MIATFDVSAQFGGRDAARVMLPHFRALKAAMKGKAFGGFPFRQLAFILRVDGEVNVYAQSGLGYIQFDEKGESVSVDLGITREVAGSGHEGVSTFVVEAITSSGSILRKMGDTRLKEVDWEALDAALQALADSYKIDSRWG